MKNFLKILFLTFSFTKCMISYCVDFCHSCCPDCFEIFLKNKVVLEREQISKIIEDLKFSQKDAAKNIKKSHKLAKKDGLENCIKLSLSYDENIYGEKKGIFLSFGNVYRVDNSVDILKKNLRTHTNIYYNFIKNRLIYKTRKIIKNETNNNVVVVYYIFKEDIESLINNGEIPLVSDRWYAYNEIEKDYSDNVCLNYEFKNGEQTCYCYSKEPNDSNNEIEQCATIDDLLNALVYKNKTLEICIS